MVVLRIRLESGERALSVAEEDFRGRSRLTPLGRGFSDARYNAKEAWV